MELGAFSVSLAVKDLPTSQAFYEKLGFARTGGGDEWAILVNGTTVIGLFEGMFDKNILTFCPGIDQAAKPVESFTDVRVLEREVSAAGIETRDSTTQKSESGPASFVIEDPDGNPILIDQHV